MREGAIQKPHQQGSEESDERVVPEKSGNSRVTPEDSMEGRRSANGEIRSAKPIPDADPDRCVDAPERIGRRAKEDKEAKFGNLLSQMRVPLLKQAYLGLRKGAASGVDGETWTTYGENLDARLHDLEGRVHRGSYHPQPVRRVYIPKADGSRRALGIPALEDKIVQQAARMLMEPIYEHSAFLGFSYGFRPGRSPHRALDAIAVAITIKKVSWVLDGDIRAFFDTIDHERLKEMIELRITDRRFVRLLMKWLHAGVMEEGKLLPVEQGTPQGGIISPLLANIYLHYALDLWAHEWRKTRARGEVYVVRYADDFVMGFQFEDDARAMRTALAARLESVGLELHPDKTRVIRFGRFAERDSVRDGRTRPETFDFLGFTHICAKDRGGKFALRRRTSRKKRIAKLASLRGEVPKRRHEPVSEQHRWLCAVLRGHDNYYGVPGNIRALSSFHHHVGVLWHRWLQRRSQRATWTAEGRKRFSARFPLSAARITHPWPTQRWTGP